MVRLRDCAFAFLVLVSTLGCGSVRGRLTEASTSLYSRHDTDETTIWAPRAHVAARVGESVGVEAAYAMDAWTSASIDIRTAATVAVHEIRHEATAGASYEVDDATVSGSYRYSTENDYWSHGGVLTAALDLAQNNTNLALSLFGAHDVVGREGDLRFRRPLDSAGARFTWTQTLTRASLLQASWETTFLSGFQSSPYRWVAIGADGLCAGRAPYCLPERTPEERYRHAFVVRYRRALGPQVSAGVGYRLYLDSWSLLSNTVEPSITFRVADSAELSADYRYYTQNDAEYYRPRYLDDDPPRYFTRDRKLAASYSHALGLAYNHHWVLGSSDYRIGFGLRSAVSTIRYSAYVGLRHVEALELTALFDLQHP